MPRKKTDKPEDLLTHNIIIRVTEALFNKLEKLRKDGGSLSIADICRKILTNRKIKIYQQDITMNPVMEELAMIRKELKAIGVNINQITRSFNQDRVGAHRPIYILKAAEQYKKVDERVDLLLNIIVKLADKWLHE
jgi:hypothetical protein